MPILAVTETSDRLVFAVVAAARFLLPLTIPRYPLPGIVASLVLDAVDQTIFQAFTSLPLQEYWLHIAQADVTGWVKTGLVGVPIETPWGEIFQTRNLSGRVGCGSPHPDRCLAVRQMAIAARRASAGILR